MIGSFSLVFVIEREDKNEKSRFCSMSQNYTIVENKRVIFVLVPGPGKINPSPFSSCRLIIRDRNAFKE